MSQKFVSTISLSLLLAAAACGLPYEQDIQQVGERYTFRYNGECSSWLYSARTGYKYCASPAIDLPSEIGDAPEFEGMEEGPEDMASLIERGEVIYTQYCQVCHQADGKGSAAFPPLAGSGDYYGSAQNHAKIIVHGLNGEIVVQGVTYNGAMAPHGHLTDYDIAAVATFERNSWGNEDGIVLPTDVAAVR